MVGVKAELAILSSVLGECDAFKVVEAKRDQVSLAIELSKSKIGGNGDKTNITIYIKAYPDQPPVFVVADDQPPVRVEEAIEALTEQAPGRTLTTLLGLLYENLAFEGDRASALAREYEAAASAEPSGDRGNGSGNEEFDDDEEFDDISDEDDDDDDDDGIFALDKMEIQEDKLLNEKHQKLIDKLKSEAPSVKKHSIQATDRLMKELQLCYRSTNVKNGVYTIELMEDNIKEWKIRIFELDKDSNIMKALKNLSEKFPEHNCIVIHASFSDEFPIKPPFFRVMSPLIQGGHVMSGGAICAEVLTTGGWSSAYSIDSLIIQVGQTITKQSTISTKGTEALDYGQYTKKNASKSFSQLLKYHELKGWGKQKQSEG